MKRVLWLTTLGSDYGEAMLIQGFADLIGPEKIVVWPFKRTYVGSADHYPERSVGPKVLLGPTGQWNEMWKDRSLYRAWKPERHPGVQTSNDGPLHFVKPIALQEYPDDRVIQMLLDGEFGLVVMGAVRWHTSIAWTELSEILEQRQKKRPPLILVDSEDYFQIRWDFVKRYHPDLYFKRVLFTTGQPQSDARHPEYSTQVFPLPFSSLWTDLPWVPWEEREWDMFCVFGSTQVMRAQVRDAAASVAQAMGKRHLAVVGHPMSHAEYLRALGRSKLVIDHQSMGADTLRFWEAASAGTCVMSDQRVECDPPLVPDQHFIQYKHDPSWLGNEFNLDSFRDTLRRVLADDALLHRVAKTAYEATRNQHRVKERARYVLDKVKLRGLNIGGVY